VQASAKRMSELFEGGIDEYLKKERAKILKIRSLFQSFLKLNVGSLECSFDGLDFGLISRPKSLKRHKIFENSAD
jgi:hypothetical protein